MIIVRKKEMNGKETANISFSDKDEEKTAGELLWNRKTGVVVDIGTTTIAMAVYDLSTYEKLGEISEMNRQTQWGADVMMRVMHCISNREQILHEMVVTQIEQMLENILERISKEEILTGDTMIFSVVGNTVMTHIFLAQDVSGMAGYPFTEAYKGTFYCTGKDIGMEKFPDARVIVPSGISAHVGSDALCMAGAVSLFRNDRIQLAVDMGTNAEIILNVKGKRYACSAAAGPAFEGKGIQCGMRAKEGAIAGASISAQNGNILLDVLKKSGKESYNAAEPRGICGSGLISLIAQLVKCHVVQEDGYFKSQEEIEENKGMQMLKKSLITREKNGIKENGICLSERNRVYLMQSDIRQFQLAKAAIQAGMCVLMKQQHLLWEDLDECIVAGVFGTVLHLKDAQSIGLLPDIPREKIRFVGNAAGAGAARVLMQEGFLENIEQEAKKITHSELANDNTFQDAMLDAMSLVPWKG